MVYIILGMHKSGTTLLADILHESGVNMVESSDESRNYYQGKKVERVSIKALNNEFLNSYGNQSLEIPVEKELDPSNEQLSKAKKIINDLNSRYVDWGFKDPRTCLTYAIWGQLIMDHKIIVVYRHPKGVMNNYKNQSWKRVGKSLMRWIQYNEKVLAIVQNNEIPSLILNYDDLLADDKCLELISSFIDKPIKDVRRKQTPKLRFYHKINTIYVNLYPKRKALQLYRMLEQQKTKLN